MFGCSGPQAGGPARVNGTTVSATIDHLLLDQLLPRLVADDGELVNATSNETTEQPTTLPDGREFAAVEETNKTEEGVGGGPRRDVGGR